MSVSTPIKDIIIDPKRFQFRDAVDPVVVRDYAELLNDGVDFPPVEVFNTEEGLILVDGFQRAEASILINKRKIDCVIHEGTVRDAILYALSANVKNAARLTNEDKRKAAYFMLRDPELSKYADNEISRRVGASQPAVSKWRKIVNEEKLSKGEEVSTTRTAKRKDGSEYQIDVGKQVESRKNSPRNRPVIPEIEFIEDDATLDEFASDESVTSETYESLVPGSIFSAGNHRVFYGDVKKLQKKLDQEYSLVVYSGEFSTMCKHQDWIINLCDNVLVQCFTGSDIRDLCEINTLANAGTIIVIDGTPSYISHYCAETVTLEDMAVSSFAIYLREILKVFTSKGDSILLIDPTNPVTTIVEAEGRVVDVVYTTENMTRKDLITWGRSSEVPAQLSK